MRVGIVVGICIEHDAISAAAAGQAEVAQHEVDVANTHLSRVEQVKRFTVLREEWLPGGDELTPTMKLKRRPIADKYAAVIAALYA